VQQQLRHGVVDLHTGRRGRQAATQQQLVGSQQGLRGARGSRGSRRGGGCCGCRDRGKIQAHRR
jgi:hypothetical protein